MKSLVCLAILLAVSAPVLAHSAGEKRSLTGMISSSDLIVFAQAEEATALKRIKNLGPTYVTRIKVFQNIKNKAPSRYLIFTSQENPPSRYGKEAGAIFFLKKLPPDSPLQSVSLYVDLRSDEEKIILRGENDLAIIDAIKKLRIALEISDPLIKTTNLKELLLDLLTHPEEQIRQEAIGDLKRLVFDSDAPPQPILTRNDMERLVGTALLQNIDLYTRLRIVILLGALKEIDSLLSLLSIEPESLRTTAVSMLGSCKNEKAVEPLIELARHENGEVKKTAIFALGRIGGQNAKKFLKEVTKKDKGEARQWAKEALRNPEGAH